MNIKLDTTTTELLTFLAKFYYWVLNLILLEQSSLKNFITIYVCLISYFPFKYNFTLQIPFKLKYLSSPKRSCLFFIHTQKALLKVQLQRKTFGQNFI